MAKKDTVPTPPVKATPAATPPVKAENQAIAALAAAGASSLAAAKHTPEAVPDPTPEEAEATAPIAGSDLEVSQLIQLGTSVYMVSRVPKGKAAGSASKFSGSSMQDNIVLQSYNNYLPAPPSARRGNQGSRIHAGQATTASYKRTADSGST